MLEIQDTLVSLDIFTQHFCCDIPTCRGVCCVEGDAGAPLDAGEIAQIEQAVETVWDELPAKAQDVIRRQGVAYSDPSGELVTSIVDGKDCVFAAHDDDGTCYCVLDRAYRQHRIKFQKPISCHLYPIRLKNVAGRTALNYDRWDICNCARKLGKQLSLPLYQFLKEPLVRRFGQEWWDECDTAYTELKKAGYI